MHAYALTPISSMLSTAKNVVKIVSVPAREDAIPALRVIPCSGDLVSNAHNLRDCMELAADVVLVLLAQYYPVLIAHRLPITILSCLPAGVS